MPIITRKQQQTGDPMLDLLYNLERRMGRVFSEPFTLFDVPSQALAGAWAPVVDIVEEPDLIKIVAEIPGVKPEDVRVSLENNILTIAGMKEQVAEEKAEKVHRYEREYGTFARTFTLPTTVEPEKIKAAYENGVLTITLPKVASATSHLVKIESTPPKALK